MTLSAQFVDQISATALVRLDLSAAPFGISAANLSPPPVIAKHADGTAVYGNRVLRLDIDIVAANEADLATQLQLLHRELNRPRNFLRWASGNAGTVYFRTFCEGGYEHELGYVEGVYSATLSIPAEPFAVGLRVDGSVVSVTNDPAAASNPMYFELAVQGDVDTPAFLRITTTEAAPATFVVASTRYPTGATLSALASQAEANVMRSADTTVQPNDAAMSGTGSNYVRTTFATTATMSNRIEFSSLNPRRGVYRVFMRHRRSVAGDTISGQVRIQPTVTGGTTFDLEAVQHPAGVTGPYWVDYGLVSAPAVPEPGVRGFDGLDLQTLATRLMLRLERVSGTGTVDTDVLQLVPAHAEHATLDLSKIDADITTTTASRALVLDGPNDTQYIGRTYSGSTPPASVADAGPVYRPSGGLPMLAPGMTNRLYILNTGNAIALTSAVSVVCSYWPRYLFIAAP